MPTSSRDTAGIPAPASPGPAGVRVVADIGATNARFATLGGRSGTELERIDCYRCEDYPGLAEALAAYRGAHELDALSEVGLAVAAPVEHDVLSLPNNHWTFSRYELQQSLGAPVTVVNDFTAQALGMDAVAPEHVQWLGSPRPTGVGTRTVVSPCRLVLTPPII